MESPFLVVNTTIHGKNSFVNRLLSLHQALHLRLRGPVSVMRRRPALSLHHINDQDLYTAIKTNVERLIER